MVLATSTPLSNSSTFQPLCGVSVASFQKQITVQELSSDGLRGIGPCAITLATAEGLDAHARAVSIRLEVLAAAGDAETRA